MIKTVITINGERREFDGSARNVSVVNGEVRINGVVVANGLSGRVTLVYEGDPLNLTCDGPVEVHGSVKGSVDAGGSVNCGDVGGNVKAGGSVNCGKVSGSLSAGGSVNCR